MGNVLSKFISEMSESVVAIVIFALVIGTILASSAFSSITIINTTTLSTTYGLAITAVTALFVLGGTLAGLVFGLKYVKKIMGKKSAMKDMSA